LKANDEKPFSQRKNSHLREKRSIAKAATSLIKPGFSIFVDAGTTTALFATELAKISGVLVITNSVEIANALHLGSGDSEVLLLGGSMLSDVPATYGELTLSEVRRFNVELAFLAPVAVSSEQNVAYFELHEAEVARQMAMQSEQTVILADNSKLEQTSRVQCCECSDVDILVTGHSAPVASLDKLKMAGIKNTVLAK